MFRFSGGSACGYGLGILLLGGDVGARIQGYLRSGFASEGHAF